MREIGWTLRATAVREIARQGKTLSRALIGAAVQNAMLVGGFLVLARLTRLRGDLLTGVFLLNLHANAMSAPLPLLAASWASGLGIGLVLMWIKTRAKVCLNGGDRLDAGAMVTSGAMFVANALPGAFLAWVTWNPIFHAVDQARGLAFANYVARHSEAWPAYAFAALAILAGLVANRAKRGPGTGV